MSSQTVFDDWPQLYPYIVQLEQEGLVTRTFRRLDPERQQVVVQAILDEAVARGPADLNIKLVARRASVSVGSLYQYFGDRDRMLDFAVELSARFTRDLFDGYRPYLAALPLRQALTEYLAGGLEWGRTQAGLVQLFVRAAYRGDERLSERMVRPIADVMRQMVEEMLIQAVQRGEVRPDIDLPATARLVNALLIVIGDSQLLPYLNVYFQLDDPALPPERLVQVALDLILRGLAPGDAGDGGRPDIGGSGGMPGKMGGGTPPLQPS